MASPNQITSPQTAFLPVIERRKEDRARVRRDQREAFQIFSNCLNCVDVSFSPEGPRQTPIVRRRCEHPRCAATRPRVGSCNKTAAYPLGFIYHGCLSHVIELIRASPSLLLGPHNIAITRGPTQS